MNLNALKSVALATGTATLLLGGVYNNATQASGGTDSASILQTAKK